MLNVNSVLLVTVFMSL